jgi:hypothetical protein
MNGLLEDVNPSQGQLCVYMDQLIHLSPYNMACVW